MCSKSVIALHTDCKVLKTTVNDSVAVCLAKHSENQTHSRTFPQTIFVQ